MQTDREKITIIIIAIHHEPVLLLVAYYFLTLHHLSENERNAFLVFLTIYCGIRKSNNKTPQYGRGLGQ